MGRRLAAALAAAVSVVVVAAPAARAGSDPYDTPLTLVNGWTSAPFGTQQAGVKQLNDGIVTFTGAIAGGTSSAAFTLPAEDRPASNVFLPVDMCNATKGRLEITPSGVGVVQSEFAFSDASCFTSLDGVSFALPSAGSNTPLTPQSGWQTAPYGNAAPGVQLETYTSLFSGVTQVSVHFTGAVSAPSGSAGIPFTLPPALRPSTTRYVPVDMCDASNGRLIIRPDGTVTVQPESDFAPAYCFTSLDGAWYTLHPSTAVAPLTLQNGWTAVGSGTPAPAVDEVGASTVVFTGDITTTGTNPVAFTLPSYLAPPTTVYVLVDMCTAGEGRLIIQPSGTVTLQAEGTFSVAACNTSLDGASFSTWLSAPG